MRALGLILLWSLALPSTAAEEQVAVIGASRELLTSLTQLPTIRVVPVKGRPRTLVQVLRAGKTAGSVLWIRVRGKAATAELYRAGKRVGRVQAPLRKGRWTAEGTAQVLALFPGPEAPARTASGGDPRAAAPAGAAPEAAPPVRVAVAAPREAEAVKPAAGSSGGEVRPATAIVIAQPTESLAAPERLSLPSATPPVAGPLRELPGAPPLLSGELPGLELSLGTEAVWRTYEFCPGALQCGRQVFAGPAGLRFVTDAPYVGGSLTLTTFPFQAVDPRLAGLGFEGRYARRFLEVGLTGSSGAVEYHPSYDEEFWGELLFRRSVSILGLEPWHGVRLGLGSRRFVTGTGAASTDSVRKLGAGMGLEGGLPLLGRWLALEAGVLYAFGLAPGTAEREAHGGAVVGSDTLRLRGGLSGRFGRAGLGYAVRAEYGLFQDSFFGAGTRAEGGSAREEFLTLTAGLRYAF